MTIDWIQKIADCEDASSLYDLCHDMHDEIISLRDLVFMAHKSKPGYLGVQVNPWCWTDFGEDGVRALNPRGPCDVCRSFIDE